MPQNDGLRRYFEAALALTEITRSRAQEVVKDLIHAGEVESGQARDWVDDLVRTSRQRSEAFVSTVRSEVRRQLGDLGVTDINELARRVADVLDKAGTAARRATGSTRRAGRTTRTASTATQHRPAARKTAAKKTAAKRTGAAKKSTAKKTAARKAPAAKSTKKAAKKTGAAKKSAGRRS